MNSFRQVRKSQSLTQKEMADKLKVSLSHYTKLEGDFVKPSFGVLKRLKDEFEDTDMNMFFQNKKA